MAPIRIAMVGLSASAKTAWAAEGHLPYLLSDRGRSKYEIVALCNSSKEAAEAAIKRFNLPSSVKAYGNPEDLAADANVDLVIVNTRVDKHCEVAVPSLKTGKAVYVEWPLAENVGRATELDALAKSHGSKTIVGLQGEFSPTVIKVGEIIRSGTVGKVVSSDVRILRSVLSPDGLPESLGYFTDIAVGGNLITVVYGHVIEFIHAALGEFKSFSSRAQIQKPEVKLLGDGTSRIVRSNVPDFVAVHGELEESEHVVPGATLAVNFRMEPPPFPGEPAFVWTIYGEKGDIKITSPGGPYLHSSDSQTQPVFIEVFDHRSAKVTQHDWTWPDWQVNMPLRARNIATLYETFAAGHEGTYATFERAVDRHREVDEILKPFLVNA